MVLSCPAASALSVPGALSPSIIDAQKHDLWAPHSSPTELKTAGGG